MCAMPTGDHPVFILSARRAFFGQKKLFRDTWGFFFFVLENARRKIIKTAFAIGSEVGKAIPNHHRVFDGLYVDYIYIY